MVHAADQIDIIFDVAQTVNTLYQRDNSQFTDTQIPQVLSKHALMGIVPIQEQSQWASSIEAVTITIWAFSELSACSVLPQEVLLVV